MLDLHVSTELFRLVSSGAFSDLENLSTDLQTELGALSGLTVLNTTPVVTATSITYSDASGSLVILGSGFAVDSNGDIISGAISDLTLTVGGQVLVDANFSTSQIALTAGSYGATLDGTFPTDMVQLFSVAGAILTVAFGGTLSPDVVTSLAPYSLTGATLTDGGTTLATLDISSSQILLDASGYELVLDGTFPSDLGSGATILAALFTAFNGGSFDIADYAGLDITNASLTDPSGFELATVSGDFTVVDGELVNSLIATGTAGDDVFPGTDFRDIVHGLAGNDTLSGGLNDDTLYGDGGADLLNGGGGNDVVDGGDGRDKAYLGAGNDLFEDNAQTGVLGQDTVFAGDGNDTIQGGGGNDVFYGGTGNDEILGRDGNDAIFGGGGSDTLQGGLGDDTVDGGDGPDKAFLGAGNDLFVDNAQGGPLGSDTVWAGAGNDTIQGGAGADVFHGDVGADLVNGGGGNDELFGGGGADTLNGGLGNDTVTGGDGPDQAFLGGGDDLFIDNTQAGPLGNDTV
ncbi:calcium-binding protein [Acidimangrovimonas pyrenivorans]|uniref:Calcium-binding protein n=1 Tax=Acidimangrovimonas pyrenivorans TaxID=2030798 RepID=A0ABV7AN73_9RHOB